MSERAFTDRLPVSPESSLPTVAATAMTAWVVLEFAFRRGLGPQLSAPLGSGLGADAVVIAVCLPLIAGLVAWWGIQAGIGPHEWDYDLSLRTVGAGLAGVVAWIAVFGGLAVLATTVLGIEPSMGPGALGASEAPAWALAALLIGNGVVAPITEELAWRGVIQTGLTESYGSAVAVVVTTLAFVGKHLIVDLAAPPFRVASLLVAALVLCGLRDRFGTGSSTVAHLGMNLLATASLVLIR